MIVELGEKYLQTKQIIIIYQDKYTNLSIINWIPQK